MCVKVMGQYQDQVVIILAEIVIQNKNVMLKEVLLLANVPLAMVYAAYVSTLTYSASQKNLVK